MRMLGITGNGSYCLQKFPDLVLGDQVEDEFEFVCDVGRAVYGFVKSLLQLAGKAGVSQGRHVPPGQAVASRVLSGLAQ
ncbi:hypothetical protein SUDANB43_05860 [Streptomyces sp. enrichment culture]